MVYTYDMLVLKIIYTYAKLYNLCKNSEQIEHKTLYKLPILCSARSSNSPTKFIAIIPKSSASSFRDRCICTQYTGCKRAIENHPIELNFN